MPNDADGPMMRDESFLEDVLRFRENAVLRGFLETLAQPVMVLGRNHRLVWANQALCDFVDVDIEDITGLSPGLVLGCGNCDGTGDACDRKDECGLRIALADGFSGGGTSHEFLLERENGEVRELRLKSSPIGPFASDHLFLVVEDRSVQNRRDMLERVFFHDLINSLGAIQGAALMLQETVKGDDTEMAWLLAEQSQEMLNEVHSHRDLFDAETGTFRPKQEEISCQHILKRIAANFSVHESFGGRIILLDSSREDVRFSSDASLLRRVLGNMVKNALEADGGVVTLGYRTEEGGIVLEVHNESIIPLEHRDRIFRRAYSTKGIGRGLGCYSMKLFGEGILGGRVWYRSEVGEGTSFCIWLPLSAPQVV